MACIFCGWTAPGRWALTVHHTDGAWERVVRPVCSRCNRLLRNAGRAGCRLKATGERWYGGHTVGWFRDAAGQGVGHANVRRAGVVGHDVDVVVAHALTVARPTLFEEGDRWQFGACWRCRGAGLSFWRARFFAAAQNDTRGRAGGRHLRCSSGRTTEQLCGGVGTDGLGSGLFNLVRYAC
jgi:hypothetical protein